ncbi:hypothetical protein D3C87_1370670 [compost metagenome]
MTRVSTPFSSRSELSCSSIMSMPTRMRGMREATSAMARMGVAVFWNSSSACCLMLPMLRRLAAPTSSRARQGTVTARMSWVLIVILPASMMAPWCVAMSLM